MQIALGNQKNWETTDLINFPAIEIRPASEINNARGAFASATNTIYLSQELVNENTGNVGAIASVLLEEYGHYIDAQINAIDSPGDEGELFADLVQGKGLSESELLALWGEDDSAIVVLDGERVSIEQATLGPISGGFIGDSKTITLDSKDGGTVQVSYQMYEVPDQLEIRYAGESILNTGLISGGKTVRLNLPKGKNSDQLQVKVTPNQEIDTTKWVYKVDTTPCPDPLPLSVELVSGKRDEKDKAASKLLLILISQCLVVLVSTFLVPFL